MARQVIGLARLKRKFKQLPLLAREELSNVMTSVATKVVALAKSLAPVDSGTLRDSIGWTWGDAPEGAMVLGTVKGGGAGNLRITIYAGSDEAFWARWVEFGTSSHQNEGLFAGSQHPGTTAQPFFYPAWRSLRKTSRGQLSRAITRSAKRAAAGS